MSQKLEFVRRAESGTKTFIELCEEFGISRQTGYKILRRYRNEGAAGLVERSRRPHQSRGQTESSIEQHFLELRAQEPTWGPRKLRRVLLKAGTIAPSSLPSISTVAAILKRNGCISTEASRDHQPMQRFEREQPNELWQMDFKGDFLLGDRQRCYPLTVTDDCSRFNVVLDACADMRTATVQASLLGAFERYGLPERMLMDNGGPWGGYDGQSRHTPLTVWLMRYGIGISHGRPYHPQTQGKAERFHGTLKRELLSRVALENLTHAQQAFDRWRQKYNEIRPHEALADEVPSSCYRVSQRPLPSTPPTVCYPSTAQVRTVLDKGKISFRGRRLHVGRGFIGQPVGLLESSDDGCWDVYYGAFKITTLDLRQDRS